MADKGSLEWDEINQALRERAAFHLRVYGGPDRRKRDNDDAKEYARGIMDAHRTLYTRALREGRWHPEPPPRPVLDMRAALMEVLHPATWIYRGNGDPVDGVLGKLAAMGYEIVQIVDLKTAQHELPHEDGAQVPHVQQLRIAGDHG